MGAAFSDSAAGFELMDSELVCKRRGILVGFFSGILGRGERGWRGKEREREREGGREGGPVGGARVEVQAQRWRLAFSRSLALVQVTWRHRRLPMAK